MYLMSMRVLCTIAWCMRYDTCYMFVVCLYICAEFSIYSVHAVCSIVYALCLVCV